MTTVCKSFFAKIEFCMLLEFSDFLNRKCSINMTHFMKTILTNLKQSKGFFEQIYSKDRFLFVLKLKFAFFKNNS